MPIALLMQNRTTLLNALNSTDANQRAAAQAILAEEGDASGTDNLIALLGKVDWNITSKHSLSGRYNFHRSEQAFGTHGFPSPGVNRFPGSRTGFGSEKDKNHTGTVQLTSVLTPRHINEFRINYTWEDRPRVQNPIPGTTTVNGVSDGANVIIQGVTDSRGRDRKSTRLNSSHIQKSRMPSSA